MKALRPGRTSDKDLWSKKDVWFKPFQRHFGVDAAAAAL